MAALDQKQNKRVEHNQNSNEKQMSLKFCNDDHIL